MSQIEEWTRNVWETRQAPLDMLDFLAIDLRNIKGISEKLKEMLFMELNG